jgi:hypothetical protein
MNKVYRLVLTASIICPVRTVIDNADNNSVTTQSPIIKPSALWPLRHAYTHVVTASLLTAATGSEVSR